MGCLRIFYVKGKRTREGGGHTVPPWTKGLTSNFCRKTKLALRNNLTRRYPALPLPQQRTPRVKTVLVSSVNKTVRWYRFYVKSLVILLDRLRGHSNVITLYEKSNSSFLIHESFNVQYIIFDNQSCKLLLSCDKLLEARPLSFIIYTLMSSYIYHEEER